MKRRIGDCIGFLSLALVIVLLADWYHSYRRCEAILLSGPAGRPLIVATGRGVLFFAISNVPVIHSTPFSCDLRSATPQSPMDRFEEAVGDSNYHLGFKIVPATPRSMAAALGQTSVEPDAFNFSLIAGRNIFDIPSTWYAMASTPFWAVIPPLGFVSYRWTRKKLQQRSRRRRGCCSNCGYDLRASPQRCPECGMPNTALA